VLWSKPVLTEVTDPIEVLAIRAACPGIGHNEGPPLDVELDVENDLSIPEFLRRDFAVR
jgi:hypothetical protein